MSTRWVQRPLAYGSGWLAWWRLVDEKDRAIAIVRTRSNGDSDLIVGNEQVYLASTTIEEAKQEAWARLVERALLEDKSDLP